MLLDDKELKKLGEIRRNASIFSAATGDRWSHGICHKDGLKIKDKCQKEWVQKPDEVQG